jgi:hypothetical protein
MRAVTIAADKTTGLSLAEEFGHGFGARGVTIVIAAEDAGDALGAQGRQQSPLLDRPMSGNPQFSRRSIGVPLCGECPFGATHPY